MSTSLAAELPEAGRGPHESGEFEGEPWNWSDKLLTGLFVFVLFVIPANVVVAGPLASNGSPARLLAFLMGLLAAAGLLLRRRPRTSLNPLRVAITYALMAAIFGYVVAQMRPLSPVEDAGSLRALLVLCAGLGIAGYLLSRSPSVQTLENLGRGLVVGGAFSSAVGIAQHYVAFDWSAFVKPPGFVLNTDPSLENRAAFVRVLGSAGHPIEYGVVLGAIAPMALHFALHEKTLARRITFSVLSVLVIGGIPFSVSRAGIVSVAVSMLVMAGVWSWRRRFNLLVIAFTGAVAFSAVSPGLLGTIRSLFLNYATDPSVQGRTRDYGPIYHFIEQSPLTGIGLGTFRPHAYFFLDNQVLLSTVEGGVVGLLGFLGLFAGGLLAARGAFHRTDSAPLRSFSQAVTAGLVAMLVCSVVYDEFSFQQGTLMTFLFLGIAGVLWERTGGASFVARPD